MQCIISQFLLLECWYGLCCLIQGSDRWSSPCASIKRHSLNMYGMGEYRCIILNMDNRWRWVVSFIPGKQPLHTYWIGCWIEPGACLDSLEQKNNFPVMEISLWFLGHAVHSLIGILTKLMENYNHPFYLQSCKVENYICLT